MAGIFGCFDTGSNIRNQDICSELRQSSLGGFAHISEQKSVGGDMLCFGYSSRSENPDCVLLSSRDENFHAVVCGELFLPSGEELSQENFESEFLSLYNQQGKSLFLECDGSYTVALYGCNAKSLHLISDPFGTFALHYANSEKGFLFSSQQHGIAKAIGKKFFSDEALAEYISLGQSLQGKTLYDNISRLPPASVLTVDRSGSLQLIRYYAPEYHNHADSKEQLRIIEDSLLQAMDIRIRRSDIALGLSGGLDSRVSLGALHKLGMTDRVTALTHGLAESYDMRIAARLAKRYGMAQRQIIFDDHFFSELPGYWREVIKLSEGGLGIESVYALASWHRESEYFGTSMESHGGPLFRRQILKASEGVLESAKDFPARFFEYISSPLLDSGLISDTIADHARKRGRSAVEDYFSSFSDQMKVGDMIDRYYLEQMCANKYSLAANAQIHFIGLSHPLLSLKAFDAATKISERQRKKNVIYTYLLNRFAPELRYEWVDNSGFPVPYRGYRILRYGPALYEKIILRLPKSFHRFSLRRPVIVHRRVAERNFAALKELLLEPDGRMDSLFIRRNIEQALADFQSGRKDNYAVLTQAANLRLMLELFA